MQATPVSFCESILVQNTTFVRSVLSRDKTIICNRTWLLPMKSNDHQTIRGGSSPKIPWGRGIAPVALIKPFITESIFCVLRNRKIRTSYRPTFEIYHQQGCQLCNGSAVAPPAAPGPRGQSPGKFEFRSILGPQKSRQNGQLAFESGATSESGGTCPNAEPPLQTITSSCHFAPICETDMILEV